MRGIRYASSVKIRMHRTVIASAVDGCSVIPDVQGHTACGQPFIHQIQHHEIDHFARNQFGILPAVGAGKHLTGTEGIGLRLVSFDILHRAGFLSPCMINQQFGIDAEFFVKRFHIVEGKPRQISHGENAFLVQSPFRPASDAPEIRQRTVLPQLFPIFPLIQFGNPHAVLIRLDALRHDVHCDFGEIQIGPDAGCRCDSGCFQHIADHRHDQLVRTHAVQRQIIGQIKKAFVNRIHMNVLRTDVLQIDFIDIGGILDIFCHTRRRDQIWYFPSRQHLNFAKPLFHLEKPAASGESICFERRRHCKADGLIRPRFIRDDKIRPQWIQSPFDTLHRGVK